MLPSLFVLAVTLVAVVAYSDVPTQIHIALAGRDASSGDADGMAVSWNTQRRTASSTVRYGRRPGVYTERATGSASAYYETYNHHAVLSALLPNTRYYYTVGDEVSGWSEEHSFTSAPRASELRGNYSFFVFGDLGVVNGQYTLDYLAAHTRTHSDSDTHTDAALVWHAGDVSYADDSFLHKDCVLRFCYEDALDDYLRRTEAFASAVPYMVTPGNHEADCHDPACLLSKTRREKLSNFTAYNHRFRMPSEESKGVLNMHYSFNFGNAHFISLDTETGYPGAAEEERYVLPCGGFGDQLAWLEQDLQRANAERALRPWIFVAGHHPMYQGASVNRKFQEAMEKLFYEYGVDIYFAGHVHSYERDLPVYEDKIDEASAAHNERYENPSQTTHVLVGGAGNDEMHNAQFLKMLDPSPKEEKGKTQWHSSDENGPWTVVTDKDDHVGIGRVIIEDDSRLRFEYVRTSSGEVFDSFSLFRDHSKYINKKKN